MTRGQNRGAALKFRNSSHGTIYRYRWDQRRLGERLHRRDSGARIQDVAAAWCSACRTVRSCDDRYSYWASRTRISSMRHRSEEAGWSQSLSRRALGRMVVCDPRAGQRLLLEKSRSWNLDTAVEHSREAARGEFGGYVRAPATSPRDAPGADFLASQRSSNCGTEEDC